MWLSCTKTEFTFHLSGRSRQHLKDSYFILNHYKNLSQKKLKTYNTSIFKSLTHTCPHLSLNLQGKQEQMFSYPCEKYGNGNSGRLSNCLGLYSYSEWLGQDCNPHVLILYVVLFEPLSKALDGMLNNCLWVLNQPSVCTLVCTLCIDKQKYGL